MALHEQSVGATDEWTHIRQLLDYEPETGVFRWRVNVANVKAGTITGSKTKKGYLLVRVNKKAHSAHRLAWFWMTGQWPDLQVDSPREAHVAYAAALAVASPDFGRAV